MGRVQEGKRRYKWGFFVNWVGGKGHNIEEDLAQEIHNKLSKAILKRMGANKTIDSISKICKATAGIKTVVENLERTINV